MSIRLNNFPGYINQQLPFSPQVNDDLSCNSGEKQVTISLIEIGPVTPEFPIFRLPIEPSRRTDMSIACESEIYKNVQKLCNNRPSSLEFQQYHYTNLK
jgi:hypothetical protein